MIKTIHKVVTHKHTRNLILILGVPLAIIYSVITFNDLIAKDFWGLTKEIIKGETKEPFWGKGKDYISMVSIFSSNKKDSSKAVPGDIITLAYRQVKSKIVSQTVVIMGKEVLPECSEVKSPIDVEKEAESLAELAKKGTEVKDEKPSSELTEEHKAESKDLKSESGVTELETGGEVECIATIEVKSEYIESDEDKSVDFYILSVVKDLESGELITDIVNETSDGSKVDLVHATYFSGDFVTNVSISSNNIDTTRAKVGDKIRLSFDLINPSKFMSAGKVTILDREVGVTCESTETMEKFKIDEKKKGGAEGDILEPLKLKKGSLKTNFWGIAYAYAEKPEMIEKCFAEIVVELEDFKSAKEGLVHFSISVFTFAEGEFVSPVVNTDDGSKVILYNEEDAITMSVGGEDYGIALTSANQQSEVKNNVSGGGIVVHTTQPQDQIKCPYIRGFYRVGSRGDEILKIREGINKTLGTRLPMSNTFDQELFVALKKWQEKYKELVLDPWEMSSPSGYFYKTSNWTMNYLMGCQIPKFELEKIKR